MKRIVCICLLFVQIALLSLSFAQKSNLSQHPLKRNAEIRYGQLDNGLTYYIWPNKVPKGEAVYRLWLKSGSLNEEDDQLGIAHFLEHMAFNGSAHFPGDRMVRFLESHGAKFGKDLNAHTTFDETVYKLRLPSSNPAVVDSTLLIMADWAYGLSFDSIEVEKEKGVILSEWIARNNKGSNTNDELLRVLFEGSRYADRPTIGDTAIVAHATSDLLRRYYQRWYRPEQMALAVVGDVEPDQVETSIRRLFAGWTSDGAFVPSPRYLLLPYKKSAATIAASAGEKKIQLDIVKRLPPYAGVQHEADMEVYVLNQMLHALIRQRLSKCTFLDVEFSDASMGRSSVVRGGDLWLSSVTLDKENVIKGIERFEYRRQQIFEFGFSQQEIETVAREMLHKARREVRSTTPRSSTKLMDELYNDYMRQMCCIDPGAELDYLQQLVPQIDSLRMLRYIQQFKTSEPEYWFLHGDSTVYGQIPDVRSLEALSKRLSGRKGRKALHLERFPVDTVRKAGLLAPPAVAGSHLVRTDTIAAVGAIRWSFDNGSCVYYRQSDLDRGKFLLTGFREGGLYHLDSLQHKAGVLASTLIPMSGAASLDNDGLKAVLAGSSASMKMLIDKNRTGVAGNAENYDIRQLFQLLYTKWMGPRVDASVFDRILVELKKSADYSEVTSQKMLEVFDYLYGSASGYHFIMTGDLPADSVLMLCDLWIGSLPSGARDYRLLQKVIQPQTADSLVYEYSEKEKATVTLTWENGLDAEDSAFSLYRRMLMCDLQKGVISSRLRQVLREEMGITYSVGVVASAAVHPVPMWRSGLVCSCLPANTDTLLPEVKNQLQQMADDPELFRSTLEDVKRNLLNQHALHLQQNTWWCGYIRNLIYNHEPDWTFADHYEQIVLSITPQQVADDIRQMLASPCSIKIQSNRQQ